MSVLQPHYSKQEFARCGDTIYEREIRPKLSAEDAGKFVLIDTETGDYEIDVSELATSDRLLARHAEAQVWLIQVGSRFGRRGEEMQAMS